MPIVMPRDALVHINGNRLTDHARSPVEYTPERIGNRTRTARGRMRGNYVADKWSFSVSWSRLPEPDGKTIDGFWGAGSIINFYRNNPGEFTFSLTRSNGLKENYQVLFTDFSYAPIARYQEYYYDLSFSVEEV